MDNLTFGFEEPELWKKAREFKKEVERLLNGYINYGSGSVLKVVRLSLSKPVKNNQS
jgi:hypothetical protein